jgi:two-component system, LytTR family, response regulator
VHHAHLVSLKAVAKFYKDGRGGYVQLTDNTHIEVSLRRKEDFLLRFGAGHGKKDK